MQRKQLVQSCPAYQYSRPYHLSERCKRSPAGMCLSVSLSEEAVTQECPGASRLHQVCVLGCTQGAS